MSAHAASEGAFVAGAASSIGDDWECLQLPAYACPPKPAAPAGLSALQELALSARPDPRKVLLTTRDFVVAYDAYPKARCHLLILPRTRIDSPVQLTRAHVPMMRAMARLAAWLAPALRTRLLPGLAPLVAGFHSVPSMRQLHLHLISIDFQAEALKHKKHWNSFTSDFLVLPVRWLEALETRGAVVVQVNAEEAKLSAEGMRCPLTGTLLKNVPALKDHLSSAVYQRALAATDARFEGEPLVGLWPLT
jgi:aprataxin